MSQRSFEPEKSDLTEKPILKERFALFDPDQQLWNNPTDEEQSGSQGGAWG